MDLFTVEDVQFSSRTQKVIGGVSLRVEKGSVTGILGRSGSGKSTLLKLIGGLLVPTRGRVLFEGRDIQQMTNAQNKDFRRRCSFVFQDDALWENQSIEQNLSLPLQTQTPSMTAFDRRRRLEEVCRLVGYSRQMTLRPVDLSMGERKRVAFARALVSSPDVLFLDECTESLDAGGVEQMMDILRGFVAAGNSVLYVSHRQDFISEMGGTIYEVDGGMIRGSDYYEI